MYAKINKRRIGFFSGLVKYNFNKFVGFDAPNWYKVLLVSFFIIPFIIRYTLPYFNLDHQVTMANLGNLHMEANISLIICTLIVMLEAILLLSLNKKTTPATAPILFLIPFTLFGCGLVSSSGYVGEVAANISVLFLVLTVGSTAANLKEPIGLPFSFILKYWGKNLYKSSASMFLIGMVGSAFLDQVTMLFIMIGGLSCVYKTISNAKVFNTEEMRSVQGCIRVLIYSAFMGSLIGGTATPIGEPQCYRIAEILGITDFYSFFKMIWSICISCGIVMLIEILLLVKFKVGQYKYRWPDVQKVNKILTSKGERVAPKEKLSNYLQLSAFVAFVAALLLLSKEINIFFLGMIAFGGMMLIQGKNRESFISHSTGEVINLILVLLALYGIAAAIAQHGILLWVVLKILAMPFLAQLVLIFLAAGIISSFSDNVFVATIMVTALLVAFSVNIIDLNTFVSLTIAMLAGTTLFSFFLPVGNAGGLCILMHPFCNEEINMDFKRMFYFGLPLIPVMALTSIAVILFAFYFNDVNINIISLEAIENAVKHASQSIAGH